MEHPEGESAVEAVPRSRLVAWIGNAPWWMLSAGIHVVVLLAATLVYMEQVQPIEEGEVVVNMRTEGPKVPVIPPDLPRDDKDRSGPPKDDQPVDPDNDEPEIIFDDALPSDHNESDDDQDYHQMLGDSKLNSSYLPGQGGGPRGALDSKIAGVYRSMGVGGGGGGAGRYGGRYGGKANLVKVGGGGGTESCVTAALKWLARHQNPDGSWKAAAFDAQCTSGKCGGPGADEFDVGVTSLSLLAFLGAGYTPTLKTDLRDAAEPNRALDFGRATKIALQWLVAQQDSEGCVGARTSRHMYNHAIAALALSEAYGMTNLPHLKEPAQKAIDFLVAAQNPGKGWRYQVRPGDNDSSVTGWAVMALKSAEMSELTFDRSAYDGALAWFNEATEQTGYYGVGYIDNHPERKVVNGKNNEWDNHYSMTAVAVMSRIFIEKKRGPALGAVSYLTADLPDWKKNKVDFYYWYYASLALFQYDGPSGPSWKKWNEPMKAALVPHQKLAKDGCANGSWSTEEDRWGMEGGRVYATAINALTLEVYYRYKTVFGGGSGK